MGILPVAVSRQRVGRLRVMDRSDSRQNEVPPFIVLVAPAPRVLSLAVAHEPAGCNPSVPCVRLSKRLILHPEAFRVASRKTYPRSNIWVERPLQRGKCRYPRIAGGCQLGQRIAGVGSAESRV